jgi:hypothetical protein
LSSQIRSRKNTNRTPGVPQLRESGCPKKITTRHLRAGHQQYPE